MSDYANLSDQELDDIISGKAILAPAMAAAKAQVAPQVEPVDNSMGMSGLDLALAGAGGDINDVYQGVKEKGQLAFRPDGEEGDVVLKRVNEDRAERKRLNDQLYANPEAVAGRFGAQALTAAAAPARLLAQIALQGGLDFMRPGGDKVTGVGSELAGSALHAGIGAGTTWGAGQGLKAIGKTLGAGVGRMTPEGETALATKDAAARLGLPPTSLGQLYPNSPLGAIERNAPGMGYGERTLEQAKALRTALDRPLQTPEGDVPRIGQAYLDELAAAGQNRMNSASAKYREVDDFVTANNLGGVTPMYSARTALNVRHPGYEKAAELLDRYGFPIQALQGGNAKQLGSVPLRFEDMHTMRVATNKAMQLLDRGIRNAEANGAPIPAENAQALKYLRDYKTALDSDIDSWAKRTGENTDAVKLYKDATAYYREVVAPTVLENPLARKAMSGRGFKSSEEGLRFSQTPNGDPLVSRLEPTMDPLGRDLTTVLRGLPDTRATALHRDMKIPQQEGGLGHLARAALGHPLTALETAMSRLPGLRALSESRPMAQFVGARNILEGAVPERGLQASLRGRLAPEQGVLPRVAYAGAQYPQDEADRKVRRLLGTR